MENEKGPHLATLFTDHSDISAEEKERITIEIHALGGLTFTMYYDEDGWTAQCNEVSGIIAGGDNRTPSKEEIEEGMRLAIFAAFGVAPKPTDLPAFTYSVAQESSEVPV